ncbi:MAG: S9 family peptidase, partial [Actinomycetota bacterium]|nr:S9 family peptidase [Actinomycetota bacterium]
MSDSPGALPYGSWPTPIDSELVVQAQVMLGEVALDGDAVWWSEQRPEEGGRTQLVCLAVDGERRELLPPLANVRTSVHEYGGGAWWVHGGTVWYAEWD